MTEQGTSEPESAGETSTESPDENVEDGRGEGGATPEDSADAELSASESGEQESGSDRAEDAEAGGVDQQLVDRVAESDPESTAREIAELRVELDGIEAKLDDREATIDELESKLARARADFQNYKKRSEARREEEAERAKADFVDRILGVHDNLERALAQDEDVDIRDGVESTLQQFDDVLESEDVAPIDPEPGNEVDPHRHQVLVRVESARPEGTVDEVHRVGYEMGETVVREAQVTVSDGSGDVDDPDEGEASAGDGDADEE